jgi:hypothetical protein
MTVSDARQVGFWLRLWQALPSEVDLPPSTASPLWYAEAVDAPGGLEAVGPSSQDEVIHLMCNVFASRLRRGLPLPPLRTRDNQPRLGRRCALIFVPKSDLR